MQTKEEKSKIGRNSRKQGKLFEIKVRRECELRGYTVCKWSNTVVFDENGDGVLSIAKSKYNPFLKRVLSEGSGFPDYIIFRRNKEHPNLFDIYGLESKKSKYLDFKEKKMATWLLDNKIFEKFYTAFPIKEGRKTKIVYQNFER